MRRATTIMLTTAWIAAWIPAPASAGEPTCPAEWRSDSPDPSATWRRRLSRLLPRLYVRFGLEPTRQRGDDLEATPAAPEARGFGHTLARGRHWQIGITWSPMALFRVDESESEADVDTLDRRSLERLCRRLHRLSTTSSTADSPAETLERELLERRLDALRRLE